MWEEASHSQPEESLRPVWRAAFRVHRLSSSRAQVYPQRQFGQGTGWTEVSVLSPQTGQRCRTWELVDFRLWLRSGRFQTETGFEMLFAVVDQAFELKKASDFTDGLFSVDEVTEESADVT